MPRRAARRIARILGRRGVILLSYGTVWALYGYGQIISPQTDQRGLAMLLNLLPLEAWAGFWIATGLIAIVSAFLPQGRDAPGFVALVLIVIPWMSSYLLSWWPLQTFPRGWVAAAIWVVIAVPVIVVAGWREPPRPKRVGPLHES